MFIIQKSGYKGESSFDAAHLANIEKAREILSDLDFEHEVVGTPAHSIKVPDYAYTWPNLETYCREKLNLEFRPLDDLFFWEEEPVRFFP